MAIIKPLIFTSIEDSEVRRNRSVTEETARKMIQNANMLSALAVIGSIRCVDINISGGGTPNTDQWQLCNGDEITNDNSPLASSGFTSRYTPNFTSRYPRGANSEFSNSYGGNPTINLEHTHAIGNVSHPQVADDDNERRAYDPPTHSHALQNALSSAETLEIAHQQLGVYIKIN